LVQARVWNAGDLRCKLVTMALTKKAAAAAVAEAVAAAGEAEAQASDNGIGIYGSGEFAAVASSRQEASADSVDNS
jgi:predicted amino acid dehydrogenase